MENTTKFVEKLHETQKKSEENLKQKGEGKEASKLSNKKHSTNK